MPKLTPTQLRLQLFQLMVCGLKYPSLRDDPEGRYNKAFHVTDPTPSMYRGNGMGFSVEIVSEEPSSGFGPKPMILMVATGRCYSHRSPYLPEHESNVPCDNGGVHVTLVTGYTSSPSDSQPITIQVHSVEDLYEYLFEGNIPDYNKVKIMATVTLETTVEAWVELDSGGDDYISDEAAQEALVDQAAEDLGIGSTATGANSSFKDEATVKMDTVEVVYDTPWRNSHD